MKYLDNLNKEPVVNNDELFGELVAALKEIKQMKIQLGKQHEAYQLEKQRNQSMQSQLKDILVEKEEILSELNQANEFVQLSREKICNLEDKCKKYDKITHDDNLWL
jgi:septal ring factor EnvC (AmiA/AmiB activator)